MCIVSNVHDHFEPLFPKIEPYHFNGDWQSQINLSELRKLIDEFKQCIEAAKKLDFLMKQPDCVDPDKAKLQERVNFLEHKLQSIKDLVKLTETP